MDGSATDYLDMDYLSRSLSRCYYILFIDQSTRTIHILSARFFSPYKDTLIIYINNYNLTNFPSRPLLLITRTLSFLTSLFPPHRTAPSSSFLLLLLLLFSQVVCSFVRLYVRVLPKWLWYRYCTYRLTVLALYVVLLCYIVRMNHR